MPRCARNDEVWFVIESCAKQTIVLVCHCDATYGEFKATVNIRELCISEGDLPRRARQLVLDWAELHQAELLTNWDLCQSNQHPNPIDPLRWRRWIMYWDVIEVHSVAPRELSVRFEDGLRGVLHIDLSFCTGVFDPLRNDQMIGDAQVSNGVLVWPNGLDLAPDTMYREIKRSPDHRYKLLR